MKLCEMKVSTLIRGIAVLFLLLCFAVTPLACTYACQHQPKWMRDVDTIVPNAMIQYSDPIGFAAACVMILLLVGVGCLVGSSMIQ